MWERAGARLERLGREGTGEGKDPRRGCWDSPVIKWGSGAPLLG